MLTLEIFFNIQREILISPSMLYPYMHIYASHLRKEVNCILVLKLGGGYGWLLCLVGLLLSFLFVVFLYDPEIECVIIE